MLDDALAGAVRCCIIGYGSNFDLEMNMDFVIITWPDHVKCETWQELQEHAQGLGGETAFRRLFRQGGEAWAPLEDLSTAYEYLDQILETGVLGLFPMGQPLEGLDQAPAEVHAFEVQKVNSSNDLRRDVKRKSEIS